MNDIQKDSLKRFDDLLYLNYSRYKKEATVDYNPNEFSYKVDKKTEEKAKKRASFIKNMSSSVIEQNKIDKDYIETYKRNVANKKSLIELAFE
jgi:hypothetical protein